MSFNEDEEYLKLSKLINDLIDFDFVEAFSNLVFLNKFKYQTYEQFTLGANLIEQLFLWLKNFERNEREIMLRLLDKIIFFSQAEMQILARLIYQEKIKRFLLELIIKEKNLRPYNYKKAFEFYEEYLEQSLFVALSDGAMIDYFRRINQIKNDQAIAYYKLHHKAQLELIKENQENGNGSFRSYRFFFLLEDFIGTGITFLRDNSNQKYWLNENHYLKENRLQNLEEIQLDKEPNLSGQLKRFMQYWEPFLKSNDNYYIIFCPYIITNFAKSRIESMLKFYGARKIIRNVDRIRVLPQLIFPDELKVIDVNACRTSQLRSLDPDFVHRLKDICDKYYEFHNESKSERKGGGVKYGFGDRGLSIVRYNNVPNNSIYLLWSKLEKETEWFPLFPRRKRHYE